MVSAPLEVQAALRTYYVYSEAFAILAGDEQLIRTKQSKLSAFQAIQQRSIPSTESALKQAIFRGWLTLKAMQQLPIAEHPDLAVAANFWAPVQAYYAVHGLGMAVLIALGIDNPPQSHRTFLASMSGQVVTRLLPHPFNIVCRGDPLNPALCPVSYENCSVKSHDVLQTSNLQNPRFGDPDLLVAKALMTTRKRLISERCDDARKKRVGKRRSRRNLKDDEKLSIEKRMHPTSVVDFLYRIRVRSNYDDPDMYIYGQDDVQIALAHYGNLLQVLLGLVAALEAILEKLLGIAAVRKLRADFA